MNNITKCLVGAFAFMALVAAPMYSQATMTVSGLVGGGTTAVANGSTTDLGEITSADLDGTNIALTFELTTDSISSLSIDLAVSGKYYSVLHYPGDLALVLTSQNTSLDIIEDNDPAHTIRFFDASAGNNITFSGASDDIGNADNNDAGINTTPISLPTDAFDDGGHTINLTNISSVTGELITVTIPSVATDFGSNTAGSYDFVMTATISALD